MHLDRRRRSPLRAVALLVLSAGAGAPLQEPTQPPAPPPAATARTAAIEAALAKLKARMPAGFAAVVEPPFVVACEGDAAKAQYIAQKTVRWAVRLLQQDFFAALPDRVLEIWLFDGNASYRKHTRELFDDQPTTPYGYYSAAHGALIMDIATGGGTLVHEIVHPFVAANAPGCPAWLNEGLGSLFEQSCERDGHIAGLTNWRLDGLQRAIRERGTIPLEQLVATTSDEFYGGGSALHYAMARYLLYWLQEKGTLRAFWRDWLATRKDDPTGVAALRRALGVDDLAAFQREWERWALTLTRS